MRREQNNLYYVLRHEHSIPCRLLFTGRFVGLMCSTCVKNLEISTDSLGNWFAVKQDCNSPFSDTSFRDQNLPSVKKWQN